MVRQDAFLFHGTVEDNLRMGNATASAAELEAAAQAANAHDFISQLPQGYDTVVGERGVRLSAGQRQRIAIARALLRDAPILVLDEALSSVDAENETIIQEALERLMGGRTTLIFAHRLSSVIDCDRILVLDGGHLVETGTHAELIVRDGPYHALMAPQLRDQDANVIIGDAAPIAQDTEPKADIPAGSENFFEQPTDAIIRAEGMSWPRVMRVLIGLIAAVAQSTHHDLPARRFPGGLADRGWRVQRADCAGAQERTGIPRLFGRIGDCRGSLGRLALDGILARPRYGVPTARRYAYCDLSQAR